MPPAHRPHRPFPLSSAVFALAVALSPRSSLIAQLYASSSAIQDSTADELTEDKYQVTLGFQTWRGRTVYRLALTENVSNFNNTPDVGVTLQVGWVLLGKRKRTQ